jgi:predicted AAA+ superfamily ATPase
MSDPLERIAAALERLSPAPGRVPEFASAEAFVWHVGPDRLEPVDEVNRVALPLLIGIDRARDILLENTLQFARGLPANNALLWGARGMGKSSLVKAVHAEVQARGEALKLIEVQREDLASIGRLLNLLRGAEARFLLFCDDLSFSHDDEHYKSLKAVLDGGIEGRPRNVVFYATSNRRHLMPRDMIENERSTAISPSEAVEEKVSLSDRFGLWLGFHPCGQDEYLAMIRG